MSRAMSRGFVGLRPEQARPKASRARFWTVGFGLLLVMGCGDGDAKRDAAAPEETPDGVYLRLRNGSSVDFDEITVSVGLPIEFGALPAHADSDYLPADGIYSYAYIHATSSEGDFIYQPTDYVGETPLGPGYYTYGLSITREEMANLAGWFDIQLFRDRTPR